MAGGIVMSDDPPPASRRICVDAPAGLEIRARLAPTQDELDALTDKELVARINGLINSVDAGHVSIEGAGDKMVVLACVQYLRDELARREQDRQAKIMTELTEKVKDYTITITIMTIAVALMSFVSMLAALWPLVHAH
jgi:hypothetical protein